MNTMQKLLLKTILAGSLVVTAQGQKVTRFIDLYNKGEIKKIQVEAKGYISPSFLRHEALVLRPIEVISKEKSDNLVNGFLNDLLAKAKKDGEEVSENDLLEFQTKQDRLSIVWKNLFKVASESGVAVSFARYKLKREMDPQIAILVMFTSEGQLVLATPLDRIARRANFKNGTFEARDVYIRQIIALKSKIEQVVAPDGE